MPGKYTNSGYKKTSAFMMLACVVAITLTACGATATLQNTGGPTIAQVTTSNKSFSIDCPPTSITVTAQITDTLGITRALLWYRVDTKQPYTSKNMAASNTVYSATVQGIDLPAGPYGALQFYITAENTAGKKSQSPLDQSVQFLPCVSN
jgi:hypothetical protein